MVDPFRWVVPRLSFIGVVRPPWDVRARNSERRLCLISGRSREDPVVPFRDLQERFLLAGREEDNRARPARDNGAGLTATPLKAASSSRAERRAAGFSPADLKMRILALPIRNRRAVAQPIRVWNRFQKRKPFRLWESVSKRKPIRLWNRFQIENHFDFGIGFKAKTISSLGSVSKRKPFRLWNRFQSENRFDFGIGFKAEATPPLESVSKRK